MAGSFSDNWESAILNHFFKGTVYNQPAHLYVGLFTAAPTDAGGGTEVTIGSNAYARVICDAWTVSGTSPTQVANTSLITFPTATPAGWGTIVADAIFDAASGGNMGPWADGLSQAIGINGVAEFLPGALVVTLD